MSKLTQEQKAEAYEKALEKAKEALNDGTINSDVIACIQGIFPEIVANEDERIRKEIICFIKDISKAGHLHANHSVEWLTWLEKHGEQNLVNETDEEIVEAVKDTSVLDLVEPKFKVGNWYQCTKDFFGKGVTFDKNTAYYCAKEGCLQCEYGCHIAIVKDLYDNFKLWTIQDAKDGDVLASDNGIIILVKESRDSSWGYRLSYYCAVLYDGTFEPREFHVNSEKFFPATKEERDTLMKTMADAGYEFDFEKKELKKIEQNPAWSEEDEQYLLVCKNALAKYQASDKWDARIISHWLENKLKASQKQWKPSEEQMKALNYVVNLMASSESPKENDYYYNVFKDLRKQLKKL